MLILFDNGTPAPLRHALTGHVVVEAIERGWDAISNGELIAAAEAAGFDLLLTTDKNIRYQQNLAGRKIAFVVLGNQQWPTLPCGVMLTEWLPPSMSLRPAAISWTFRSSNAEWRTRRAS